MSKLTFVNFTSQINQASKLYNIKYLGNRLVIYMSIILYLTIFVVDNCVFSATKLNILV